MPTPVFLHYDREALDREYNNRAKVPNALEMLDGFTRKSAEARAAMPRGAWLSAGFTIWSPSASAISTTR